ncbi:hypothetical protein K7I13_03225 [Brucepastera parasyntrophica]|uniref:hypothetical protein n=1 Tax=Brucepastera parasyntrophica TaxID=2880008 RepID=UPI002109E910|nr:hypothetical protein [Brucepastera parasyntrophica]ULQ60334.1 hypothetical protein K7I13_03225 [Brucepastera parasyntrophica]
MIDRARINALLEEGIRHSMVTVIAAPGYGKTQAVSLFTQKKKKVLWLHLSSMDNIPQHFWENFLRSVNAADPDLAAQIKDIGYPDTAATYIIFLRILASNLYNSEPLIWVVDDFSLIYDQEIKHFFEFTAQINLENFCFIIISSVKTDLGLACIKGGGSVYQLTAESLRFTAEETAELFEKNKIQLPGEMLEKIDRYVAGWPLGLYLLMQHMKMKPHIHEDPFHIDMSIAYNLFEKEYFSVYEKKLQKLLIRMTLLRSVPYEMLHLISECEKSAVDTMLEANLFIEYDPRYDVYYFYSLYNDFLSRKQYMLDEEEIKEVYSIAGDWYYKHSQYLDAVKCYGNCGRFDEMLQAVIAIPKALMQISLADFLLEHLSLLPADFLRSHPIAEYLKASLFHNIMEVNTAERMLLSLEERIKNEKPDEPDAVLGEVYIMLAAISFLRNTTDFVDHYKNAAKHLPAGSLIQKKNQMIIGEAFPYLLPDSEPGALQRMEAAFLRPSPIWNM